MIKILSHIFPKAVGSSIEEIESIFFNLTKSDNARINISTPDIDLKSDSSKKIGALNF
jgi:hypothetical protein